MKRKIQTLICLIFAVLFLVVIVSCGGGSSVSTSALPQPSVDCGGQSCIQ